MPDDRLPQDFITAGARQRQADVPDAIDVDFLRVESERLERILRLQYEDKKLPPRDEQELARHSPDQIRSGMRRWAFLKHCYYKRSEQQESVESADALESMLRLMVREPVEVDIGTRVVQVTDRSYAALYEIARHQKTLLSLSDDLDRLQAAEEKAISRRREDKTGLRALGRRVEWLRDIQTVIYASFGLHRKAIYAHLMTEDGAPAKSLDDAPDWWVEVTPEVENRLILAVREAAFGRMAKLGPPPKPSSKSKAHRQEDWGWLAPLADFDKRMKVTGAPHINRPLGQTLARERAGADPVLDDMD